MKVTTVFNRAMKVEFNHKRIYWEDVYSDWEDGYSDEEDLHSVGKYIDSHTYVMVELTSCWCNARNKVEFFWS